MFCQFGNPLHGVDCILLLDLAVASLHALLLTCRKVSLSPLPPVPCWVWARL